MKTAVLDGALLVLFAAVLILPLFQVEYLDNWMSIDGAFIADARFLSEHLPAPGWVPNFYCGNRLDYLYPPALRYGTALIARYGGWSAARAYHIYSALFYCLSVAGVYALVRAGSRSRLWAILTALGSVVLSPVLLLFKGIRDDSALHMPQHLNVIVKWGEVPHMSAMGVLLGALAAGWLALRANRPAILAATALLCALCVSNNFYGATALAVFFPLMVWTLWVADGGARIWWRAAGIAGLSYALTACWMTPSYIALTITNLKLVAQPGDSRSRILALAAAAVFAGISFRLGRHKPERAWPLFLAGALGLFGLSALGGAYFAFHAFGQPARFVPEFDLLLVLAAIECLRRGRTPARICAGLLLALSLITAFPYLRDPWAVFVRDSHPERRIEYRLSDWFARNLPGARVHTDSSVGFWSGAWNDVPQVGGVADQGLQNQLIALANWQILNGYKPARDIDWLLALGADAIAVHGKRSQEVYHPMLDVHKYAGRLPVLFENAEDDVVYRVPRRFPGLARVVDRRRMETLLPIPWSDENEAQLHAYAEALEKGPDSPATSRWLDTRTMRIRARTREGESVAVQVTYDPWWRAYSGALSLPIHRDVMGLLRIDPPPGDHEIRLEFETPLETLVGRAVSVLALLVLAFLASRPLRSRWSRTAV